MKKKILVLGCLVLLITVITGCTKEKVEKDSVRFKEDYEKLNGQETSKSGVYYREITIDQDNPIVYSSFKEVKEMIDDKESFIVYVGFSACPWCRSVVPYMLESAKENNIKKIYYVNVRSDNTRESDLRGYYKLDENNNIVVDVKADPYYYDVLNTLDEFLEPYTIANEIGNQIPTGENRLYAPTLIVYKNGKAVLLDECISDKQTGGYDELTDEMISDMKEKANNLFEEYNK